MLKKLEALIPTRAKPIVYGAIVGIPLGVFYLLHKTSASSATTSSSSGTLSYNGTGIPVGGPENTVTNTRWLTRNVNHYIPMTAKAKAWANLQFWRGFWARENVRLRSLESWVGRWHNKRDIAALKDQRAHLGWIQRQLKAAEAAYAKASKGK